MTDQKDSSRPGQPKDLRRRAEKRLRDQTAAAPKSREAASPEESLRLIHELQVHQIELEMQNDELNRALAELEASRARYFDLYDLAPVGYLTVSEEWVVLEGNLTAASLLGVARSALAGLPFSRFVLPEDQDNNYLSQERLLEPDAPGEWEVRMIRADNSSFFARLQTTRMPSGERRIALSDITEHKKIENAQNFLLNSGYPRPGEDFLHAVARFLAENLGVDFVCIDRLQGDELNARTVAVYSDGRFEDNVEYALRDTPCGEVVGKTICRFEAGVRQRFPRDAMLQELAAESYVGATLWSFDGKPIGLIALIWRKPLAQPHVAEAVLKLLAMRAAAELERQQAEAEILAQSRFPSENPNPVMRLDPSGVVLYANEAGHALLRGQGCSVGVAAPELWRNAVIEASACEAPRTIEATVGGQTWSMFVVPIASAGYVNLYATNVTERARAERALRERYKELECLHGVSVLMADLAVPLDETAQSIVERIPPAMQFPEFAVARIVLKGRSFQTAGFRETAAMLFRDVLVQGESVGAVQVCYLEGHPSSDDGPFLAEERLLLNAIAQDLGRLFGHVKAMAAVQESEERYRLVVESSRDLIYFLDRCGRLRWLNAASHELFGAVPEAEDLLGRVHPEDSTRAVAAWEAAWAGHEGSPAKISYRVRAVDGGYHSLESAFRRIHLAGEELLCAISTDTTELVKLRRKLSEHRGIAGIVGRDPKMLALYASIRELAEADAPVLLLGESGTGKELVATAIHRESPRARRNFVAINCGAIPDTLLETELFGHVRGAFTGAVRDKKGRFEMADGGTIFLDEVGDLSPAMQVKLLRVLQEGSFERVGAEKPCTVDVRVISATNRDLRREVAAGRFREDLFYRLSVVPLNIPPLRERVVDIPLLVEHILGEEARRTERRRDPARAPRKLSVTREALALLLAHPWPGNVRELQNVLRYAMIKCKGNVLRPEHLPPFFTLADPQASPQRGRRSKLSAGAARQALEEAGGNAGAAARRLGVSRATFYRHLPKTEG